MIRILNDSTESYYAEDLEESRIPEKEKLERLLGVENTDTAIKTNVVVLFLRDKIFLRNLEGRFEEILAQLIGNCLIFGLRLVFLMKSGIKAKLTF